MAPAGRGFPRSGTPVPLSYAGAPDGSPEQAAAVESAGAALRRLADALTIEDSPGAAVRVASLPVTRTPVQAGYRR
jgi:hypothetical protein